MKQLLFISERIASARDPNNIQKVISFIEQNNFDYVVIGNYIEWEFNYIYGELETALSKWLQSTATKTKIIFFVNNVNHTQQFANIEYVECNIGTYHLYNATNQQITYNSGITQSQAIKKTCTGSKLFCCLNRVVKKHHRMATLDKLAKENLISKGIVTALRLDDCNFEHFNANMLERYSDDFNRNYASGVPPEYLEGFVDIVTETSTNDNIVYISEKTAKPIVTLKPFLIIGPPNTHKFLHERFGVEPYTEIFDYSFDSDPDYNNRVDAVVSQIKDLEERISTTDKRTELYLTIIEKCINNKNNMQQYFNQWLNREKDILYNILVDYENTHVHFFDDKLVDQMLGIIETYGTALPVDVFQHYTVHKVEDL